MPHIYVPDRERDFDAVSPETVPDKVHDFGFRLSVRGKVDQRIPYLIVYGKIAVADHANPGRRQLGDAGNCRENIENGFFYLVRLYGVAHSHVEVPHYRRIGQAVIHHILVEHLAVRYEHFVVVERPDPGRTERDVHHAAFIAAGRDPVTLFERLFKMNREPREHVGQGALERQTDRRG